MYSSEVAKLFLMPTADWKVYERVTNFKCNSNLDKGTCFLICAFHGWSNRGTVAGALSSQQEGVRFGPVRRGSRLPSL